MNEERRKGREKTQGSCGLYLPIGKSTGWEIDKRRYHKKRGPERRAEIKSLQEQIASLTIQVEEAGDLWVGRVKENRILQAKVERYSDAFAKIEEATGRNWTHLTCGHRDTAGHKKNRRGEMVCGTCFYNLTLQKSIEELEDEYEASKAQAGEGGK